MGFTPKKDLTACVRTNRWEGAVAAESRKSSKVTCGTCGGAVHALDKQLWDSVGGHLIKKQSLLPTW